MKVPENFKEEFEKSQSNAQKQHKAQRIAMKKDIMEHCQTLHQRLRKYLLTEEIDYSIHNFILMRFSFKNFNTHLEVVRAYYRNMYFIIRDFQETQNDLKDLLVEMYDKGNERQKRSIDKLISKSSPFEEAREALEKISKSARNRSKDGIRAYTAKDANDLGIKL